MNDKNFVKIEVCVDSVESALAAQQGGAARVELCSDLAVGGITPGAEMIAFARKQLHVGLHVMIRPRGGDFFYSDPEFNTMQRDVLNAKAFGADGVVLGVLNADNTIDVARTRLLVELAKPMNVTFHRAFDVVADPFVALEEIIQLGIDRILTSGQAPTAFEGMNLISQLVQKAAGRVSIMAGSGINMGNVRTILERTGVKEIHVGTGVTREVEPANGSMFDAARRVVDPEKVTELVAELSNV